MMETLSERLFRNEGGDGFYLRSPEEAMAFFSDGIRRTRAR
jgi:hypothetical protein